LVALLFIKSSQPGEYLILSDSFSSNGALRSQRISARTRYIINECKKVLWWLRPKQFKVRLMWIPAHFVVPGNEVAEGIARDGAQDKLYYLNNALLLSEWQRRWNRGEIGRYVFSISPCVQLHPWFHRLEVERPFITVVSSLMSG
jgi:hypothetical protein